MDRVRYPERCRLLGKTFILIRLPHDEAPRLFRPMAGDKQFRTPVDISIPWTWARSDETQHALNCSPVVTRGMVVG